MTGHANDMTGALSAEDLASLPDLLAANARLRVVPLIVGDRRVWVKRYDVERMPFGKVLHALVSPLLPVFLRSSSRARGQSGLERERRKMERFRSAGFPVADILFADKAVLVLSDAGEVAQKQLDDLRCVNAAAHDDLLVKLAQALGEAHRAGLCHGRPHPRDMFLRGDRVGFLDFEEEPEAVMPLPMAQARDLWLLFLQISSRAALPGTQMRAFATWRAAAPAAVVPALAQLVGFFHRGMAPLRLLSENLLGKDALYAVKATSFLKSALDAAPAPASSLQATGRERPRGQS
ncbi:hypothetical protein [Aquamicrobium defluvii]|uniref:Serine/threonine protein phosphatase n=1 Tax=Aquamicrobium defluvii TaxID=69279 RepID=A0A011TBY8_9HYPH|nr:hypothetical protein [Aquamicrobium defluvii]EXL09154.1 serine/threonine protein phosphatase [Aquamicrobium defluvii]EZQ17345.1 serine/threonine protein phosphatase [Halopseudomonas bauzanensis]TDR37580.1 hypothetical protein DES43_102126 [Aquamicrobium defluvii]